MAFICLKKKLQSKEDHCSIEQIALWWQIFSFILVGVLWLPVFQLMLTVCLQQYRLHFFPPNLSELSWEFPLGIKFQEADKLFGLMCELPA